MSNNFILDFEKPIVELEDKIDEMRKLGEELDIEQDVENLEKKVEDLKANIYKGLTRWQRVQIARHPERPITSNYLENSFDSFIELHGDRKFRDDPAIMGGMATIGEHEVMFVGHQKGRDTKSNIHRNFGMPNPDGYRKALRLFKLAEKFNKPIVCFLDTPGAYPGIEAEERGQAEAIADNLLKMASLKVPIIVVVIGEGASGGALGIGIGDRVLMLENSWYSVIAPESCSSILWKTWDYKEQAAEALKLTAPDLKEHKIIDGIVEEPVGGAHKDPEKMFTIMRETILKELKAYKKYDAKKLVQKRHEKFLNMGVWEE
ncbi:MAG: acetyl-CoA carboxylase carboxyltransferase subunit alpha [Chlorobiota bacterium]